MRAPIDDLIMHAAYLVCPHVYKQPQRDGSVREVTTEMGHAAFKEHIKMVQAMTDENEKREAVGEGGDLCGMQ